MKKIGVIGGLGPLATVDFFKKVVDLTGAKSDQENIPILIYNNPQIPDRTQAILYGGVSPVDDIIKTGKVLEKMGADFLCLPCNTSFYFYEEIQKGLGVQLLNMIDLTVDFIKENAIKKLCVLGTEGTIKSGIYTDKLDKEKISYYKLDTKMEEYLTRVIYDIVKKNDFPDDVSFFTEELDRIIKEEKVDAFILGCTELPIFFKRYNLRYNCIDPTLILAQKAVDLAKKG